MSHKKILYVTYDGLNEQLGQSQVLPYLRGLVERGHRFEVLSFEKPGHTLCFRKQLSPGIVWTALRYHKRPTVPATAFDVAQGLGTLAMESILGGADIIHVRSYVPAVMALPWVMATKIPLLFDMRGLWADERVEAGTWPEAGGVYRAAKSAERTLLGRADAIITLTVRLQRYLREEYPFRDEIRGSIHVVPTCVDLAHFTPNVTPNPAVAAELQGRRVLLYLGAIGSYYLPREMALFYIAWRKYASPSRLLVVSRQDAGEIRHVLAEAGCEGELVYRTASREEVPALVRCAEASFGLFGGRILAGHGCAPTKTGETLACGIPFASSAVGDVEVQCQRSPAVISVPDTRLETLDAAAHALAERARAPDIGRAARSLAERWFSLAEGVDAYDAIYRRLPLWHGATPRLADTAWPVAGFGKQVV